MAQPLRRDAVLPPPGPADADARDWVGNPWLYHDAKKNLSAFERNRVYLNHQGVQFFDISFLTNADSDGDGRSAVPCDINNDGMMDLLVRQVGGGPLLVFENHFPHQHWLKVSLQGTKSNSLGIGSRVIADAGSQQIVRELYPANTFQSQAPAYVHFGLGEFTEVDRLTIRWPSGIVQVLEHVPADQHIEVIEGDPQTRKMAAR